MEESKSERSDVMQQGVSKQTDPGISESFRSTFSLDRELPNELSALDAISLNYLWSWLPGGVELFRDLSPPECAAGSHQANPPRRCLTN